MKKIKSIPVYLLLLIFCSMFVVSCSEDNLVTQIPVGPYQYDSARFDYNVTRLQGVWYDTGELWAQDTSQTFIVNTFYGEFVHIINGVPNYYIDPNFSPSSIAGLNNNEVYLSGLLKVGNKVLPGIKKWNGSYLEDFPIDLSFNKTTFINKSLIRSSSDMWLFCNNVIIRKDGNNFLTYNLVDAISKVSEVWFDQDGTPTYSQVYFNSNIGPLQSIKIYKFYNEWTKVFENHEEIGI